MGETGGLFVIDAETGDVTQLTRTVLDDTNTITAQATAKNNGTYGFRARLTAGSGKVCIGMKDDASTEIWARVYFQIPVATSIASYAAINILSLWSSNNYYAGDNILQVAAFRDSGTAGAPNYLSASGDGISGSAAFTFTPGQWYCVEVHWKKSATVGVCQVWVDEVSKINLSSLNTNTYSLASVMIGTRLCQFAADTDFWYDDFKASATGYVGLYSAGGGVIGPSGAIASAEDVDGAAMMRGTIQSEV